MMQVAKVGRARLKVLSRLNRFRIFGFCAAVVAGLAGSVVTAQAQWLFGTFGQPGPEAPDGGLSPRDIRRIAAAHGLRLLTPPFQNGRVFVVDALDRGGNQQRLIIDGSDGTILQRFRVRRDGVSAPDQGVGYSRFGSSAEAQPPTDPDVNRPRRFFGFSPEDQPPVPAENVPGDRPRTANSHLLPNRDGSQPALASVNPDPNQSIDQPPAPLPDHPKLKPKRQTRVKHPDQPADSPATTDASGPAATPAPKLIAPPVTEEHPVAAPKSVVASQPSPVVAPPPPRVVKAPAAQPQKPKEPLNDIPPAPLD